MRKLLLSVFLLVLSTSTFFAQTQTTLTLTAMCWDKEAGLYEMRLTNPTNSDIDFTWEIYNTENKGNGTVLANSDIFFYVPQTTNAVTVIVSYNSTSTTKATNVKECEETSGECGGIYVTEVIDWVQGTTKGGGTIAEDRSDPKKALGEYNVDFYSLGFANEEVTRSYVVYAFDKPVKGGVTVWERTNQSTTYGEEKVDVYTSWDGLTWNYLGVANNADKALGESTATYLSTWRTFKYVKLVNMSDPQEFDNSADGFDVAAICAEEYADYCEIPNLSAQFSVNGTGTGTSVTITQYYANGNSRDVFAGLLNGKYNGTGTAKDIKYFCIDLYKDIKDGLNATYKYANTGLFAIDQIRYILDVYYPIEESTGLTSNQEAAAVQLAIWHYSDSLDLTKVTNSAIKTRAQAIVTATESNYAGWTISNLTDEGKVIVHADKCSESQKLVLALGDDPLPVELTSFTANASSNVVSLTWSTATEVNNYGFEIERNGEKIGFVEGNGNSNSPLMYSFTDNSATTGKFNYRLKQIDFDGKFEYSETIEVEVSAPEKFELTQNYPNPFNPTTNIRYSIDNPGMVRLVVYNVLGEEVAQLVNETKGAGIYNVTFDASNLNSGIYIYRLESGNQVQMQKMMLVK